MTGLSYQLQTVRYIDRLKDPLQGILPLCECVHANGASVQPALNIAFCNHLVRPVARDPADLPGPPARSGAASRRGSRTRGSGRAGVAAVRRRRGGAAGTATGAGRPRVRGRYRALPRGVPRHVRGATLRYAPRRPPELALLVGVVAADCLPLPVALCCARLGQRSSSGTRTHRRRHWQAAALRRSSGLCLHPVLGA